MRPDSTKYPPGAAFPRPTSLFREIPHFAGFTLHYLSSLLLSKLQNQFWGLQTGPLKPSCVLFCFDFLAWTNTLIINWGLPIWGWLVGCFSFFFFFGGVLFSVFVFVCVFFSLSLFLVRENKPTNKLLIN